MGRKTVLEPLTAKPFAVALMRAILTVLLLCLAVSARAREWKSELFHCTANVPDSTGWQMIEAPQVPGIAPVLVMQNTARQAVFGINVIEKYQDANLADPAIQKDLEATLRQFGYQFVGHSTVKAGVHDWLQYAVRAGTGPQQMNAIIRYTSAGGYVFCITMQRGGGQEAAQDAELQQAAASFRVLPATAVAAAAATQGSSPKGTPPPVSAQPLAAKAGDKPEAGVEEPATEADESRNRLIWYGGGGLVVLLVFFGIIGGGRSKKR